MGEDRGERIGVFVILAAGVGDRLRPHTEHLPKALIRVAGRTFLERHLEHITARGSRVVIVGGHGFEEMVRFAAASKHRERLQVIYNAAYAKTGSGRSLLRGVEAALATVLESGCAVGFMDADLLYVPALMDLIFGGTGDALLVGEGSPDDAEAVKTCGPPGRVLELRKRATGRHAFQGESVGIGRVSAQSIPGLFATLAALEAERAGKYEWEEAIEAFAASVPLSVVRVPAVHPWMEIDDAKDLARASALAPRVDLAPGS